MSKNLPMRSLPLRDLLNQLEHKVRELHEHLHLDLSKATEEMHNLTRPKRRKSGFPTIRAVSNGYEKYAHALRYADKMMTSIEEGMVALEARVADVQ